MDVGPIHRRRPVDRNQTGIEVDRPGGRVSGGPVDGDLRPERERERGLEATGRRSERPGASPLHVGSHRRVEEREPDRAGDGGSRRRHQVFLGELERGDVDHSCLPGSHVGLRGLDRICDLVVADDGHRSGPGVDEAQLSGRGRVAVDAPVDVQIAVRPHDHVARRRGGAVVAHERRLHAAPHRVNRDERTARHHKQRHVGEREGRDIGLEVGRVDQRFLGRKARADPVGHDPVDAGDRLEPQERVGGSTAKGGIELRRQPLVRRDRHVVTKLIGGVRGSRRQAGVAAATAGRAAGREVDRADEWIEFANGALRQIVEVVALRRARLVIGDVRVAADVEQRARRVEHRDRQVAPEPVRVVDVEHRGP